MLISPEGFMLELQTGFQSSAAETSSQECNGVTQAYSVTFPHGQSGAQAEVVDQTVSVEDGRVSSVHTVLLQPGSVM